jgi:predicted MFS family arabinose efflux permease
VSTALLAAAAFLTAGRVLVSSSFGLATAPEVRPAAMGLRAATMQFGYFAGSIIGGAALAVGGYDALGMAMGGLFLAAAATLAPFRAAARRTVRTVVASRPARDGLPPSRPARDSV